MKKQWASITTCCIKWGWKATENVVFVSFQFQSLPNILMFSVESSKSSGTFQLTMMMMETFASVWRQSFQSTTEIVTNLQKLPGPTNTLMPDERVSMISRALSLSKDAWGDTRRLSVQWMNRARLWYTFAWHDTSGVLEHDKAWHMTRQWVNHVTPWYTMAWHDTSNMLKHNKVSHMTWH